MSQQVNLFENNLVKSKDWFTLSFVAIIYVFAAVIMVYFYTDLQSQNAQIQIQRNQAVAQYETTQKKVNEFSQRLIPVDNTKLEAELKGLQSRFEMQSEILDIFQQSISEQAYHLIDYMRALAAQQQPGLWLTGFKIEPESQNVTLLGQALQTQDIPLYLDLLSAQRVFEGTQFSGLQFKQVELIKNTAIQNAAAAVVTALAAVVNELQTSTNKGAREEGPNSNSAGSVPTTQSAVSTTPPTESKSLKVYAFEVKGQDLGLKSKKTNALSWDDFVRQTVQQPTAKQP